MSGEITNHEPLVISGPRVEQVRVFGSPLAITRLPLCPEITLWLMSGPVEKELMFHYTERLQEQSVPYWAFCWGGGHALARYILDNPEQVRDKQVVDFGCGSAVVAIAAALSGAAQVVAVDCDPMALRFAEENALLNRVQINVAEQIPEQWEVLLASDVLYDASLREWFLELARSGRTVLVCEPNRRDWPRYDLEPVQTIQCSTVPDVDQPVDRAYVYWL